MCEDLQGYFKKARVYYKMKLKLTIKEKKTYNQCKGECDKCLLDGACGLQDKLNRYNMLGGKEMN